MVRSFVRTVFALAGMSGALAGVLIAVVGWTTLPVNEPSHIVCGAPDFIVERREVPTGQFKGKDVGSNLEPAATNEQLKRCGSTDKQNAAVQERCEPGDGETRKMQEA